MNKIDTLIVQRYPNGMEYEEKDIEWSTLGEIGKVCMCKRVMKYQTKPVGDIPFYKISTFGKEADAYISKELYVNYKKKYSFPQKGEILISASGTIGRTVIYNGEPAYFQDSNIVWINNDETRVTNKFLFYVYQTIEWKTEGGTIARLYNDNLAKIKIPIPPLAIQQEIVNILDKFDKLQAELQAELQARRTQYEYYRNELLNFDGKEIEWKILCDTCTVSSGGTPSTFEKSYWANGTIPWLKSEVCKEKPVLSTNGYITKLGLLKSSAKLFSPNTTLIALVGATKCKTAFLEFEATTNQNIAGIKSKDENLLLDKFVFYYLMNLYKELIKNLGQYDMLNLSQIRGLKIPIPPLDEQERIVSILDKFYKLVNDISEGLPAEIEARRKQYEYYRGKLLNFKSINNG